MIQSNLVRVNFDSFKIDFFFLLWELLMKKTLLALASATMLLGGTSAFASCPSGVSCPSTNVTVVTPAVSVTGTVSNSIGSLSTSNFGSGGSTYVKADAYVMESATATGGGGKANVPNGTAASITGFTATEGAANVNSYSNSTGTGTAGTSGVAYGSATASLDLSSISKNANGSATTTAALSSGNSVGVGYSTSGTGVKQGGASVTASSYNLVNAYASIADCLPGTVTGTATDTKFGTTSTPTAVSYGDGTGTQFSPFDSGITAQAYQNAVVNASFTGKQQ